MRLGPAEKLERDVTFDLAGGGESDAPVQIVLLRITVAVIAVCLDALHTRTILELYARFFETFLTALFVIAIFLFLDYSLIGFGVEIEQVTLNLQKFV